MKGAVHLLEICPALFGHLHSDAALSSAYPYHSHGTCCPNHRYKALDYHHIVKGHAPLALTLCGPCDKGDLGRMKAREDTASNRHEERRDEALARKIRAEIKAVKAPGFPHIYKRISLYKEHYEYADGGQEKDRTEYGVDLSDYLVNGKNSSYKIVSKDRDIDDPG